ncbi:MAG: SseB family protein [Gammaproteobacteria bacterium]|nr:SseB family protein [Gammaproteobacteria bacterium]
MSFDEPFTPHNELEQQLIAAQEGSIPGDDFMHYLLTAQVFMPVQDETHAIKGFQRSDKAVPLTLETEDGMQVVVLFSSPERAKPFLVDYPGYTGGLLTEFKWVLERMGSGYGVAVNPGWSVGIDMDPDMIDQMVGR